MFSSIPYDLLQKNTCQNKKKKCNILNPYSKLQIIGDKKSTEKEKSNNLKRYNTSCFNRSGKLKKCCDKFDKKLDGVLKKIKYKSPYGKPVYNKYGELETIELCNEKDKKCKKNKFKKLNAYELCKIPKNYNLDNGKITKFNQDCYETKCNPQESTMDITGVIEENYTYEFDKDVSNVIKNDNLKNLQNYISKDNTLKYRALTHNAEGNTIYHEALKFNSEHILVYLYKNVTSNIVNKLNSKGETILHMIMKKDNKNILMLSLKIGCDVNARNNNEETPIFYAIREGLFDNVRIILNYNADIYVVNKKEETLLELAVGSKNRNLRIIKLLIDNGAKLGEDILLIMEELDNKTVNDQTIITYLNRKLVHELKIPLKKELSKKQTSDLEGILYDIDESNLDNNKYDFRITVDYEKKNLKFPKDLHYPKTVEGDIMKPYDVETSNYSHEPYFKNFEKLQKKDIKKLQQSIQLAKWDNKRDFKIKNEIIKQILNGDLELIDYRKKVILENEISKEQEFLLDNLKEDDLLDFDSPTFSPAFNDIDKVTLTTEENNKGNETPIDISTTKDIEFPEPVFSESFYDKYGMYILIGLIVLVGIIIAISLFKKRKKQFEFFN